MTNADVVVVGGGIAGVSVAYFLAEAGLAVTLVEAEAALAHHTTGRSAAQYLENYGNDTVRRLTIGGRPFFTEPPAALVDAPVWTPRPMLRVARPSHAGTLRAEAEGARQLVPSTRYVDPDEAAEIFPPLRREHVGGGVVEPDAMDLDVAGLHQLFVRGLRGRGGAVLTSSPVRSLERTASGWRVLAGESAITCDLVVNAAGAWGDPVAELADVEPLGLRPLRRTVCIVSLPDGDGAADWPLVAFEDESTMEAYCKPEPGGLLLSPADETPSPPCDARPEEIDVALALDRLTEWTTLKARHVRATWAGLRTFTADRTPVAGPDPVAPGFFWLVGQGGYGIQTAPGLGRAAAGLIVDASLPADLTALGLTPADLAPDRAGVGGEPVTPSGTR